MTAILVAGGGLAGAAAALALAQAGRAVTLVEREAGAAHKICGEFLSAEAQACLVRLGLDVAALGGAPISRLRLVRGARTVSTGLPFKAIGISRFKLDEALLQHAQASGVTVLRGRAVRKILIAEKPRLDIEAIGIAEPDILMLATGKHEPRGMRRDFTPRGSAETLIGFKMYFRLRPQSLAELRSHIDLIVFPGGYAGLQLVEDETANLCLLVERERYRRCGASWPQLLEYLKTVSAYLADQLAGSAPLLPQPLSIYRVPYGFIHPPQTPNPPNLFRLGDQACVIQSFTGDGMSIALHSAALAAQAVLAGQDSRHYHRRLAGDVRGQMKRADALFALLNHPLTQAGMFEMARLWPASLRLAAQLTRVPVKAGA